MSYERMIRVSRSRRCPICGRPDWCLVSPDNPPTSAICSRIDDGARRRVGDAGWLHVLREDFRSWNRPPILIPLATTGGIDFDRLAEECVAVVDVGELARLADGLGLTVDSLHRFRVGWSARHRAWSFPMLDADGRVRGIRLRYSDGRKLAVRGGREGLFVPSNMAVADRLLAAEGATDAAALVELGFAAVGRPSCTGGIGLLCDFVRRRREREVVIVADADASGRRGAENLAATLVAYCPVVRTIEPPPGVKDARAWKTSGATAADVAAVIERSTVRTLRIAMSVAGSAVRR